MASTQEQLELAIISLLLSEPASQFTVDSLRRELRETDPTFTRALQRLRRNGLVVGDGGGIIVARQVVYFDRLLKS